MKAGILTCLSFIGAMYMVSAQELQNLLMLNVLSGGRGLGGLFGMGESNQQPPQQSYSPSNLPIGIPPNLQTSMSQISRGNGGSGQPGTQTAQQVIPGYNPYGGMPGRSSQQGGGSNGLGLFPLMAMTGSDAMKSMMRCQMLLGPSSICASQMFNA